MSIVSFDKYHGAKTRADAKAKELAGYIEDNVPCYVFLPSGIDPFSGNLEQEIARVLYESELWRERNKAPSGHEQEAK